MEVFSLKSFPIHSSSFVSISQQGLCREGEGGKLIDDGDVTYGGRWVVNPSGGLISKGHPLGATGIAQCTELNWQVSINVLPSDVISASAAEG